MNYALPTVPSLADNPQPTIGLTAGSLRAARDRPAGGLMGESEAFVRWQRDRDPAARDLLVQRHLPLARKLAGRYRGACEPLEDLVQVASLGLIKAIDRFDPERGLAFASFAVPTILGELKRYFRDLGWATHVPRGAKERALKIQRVNDELTNTLGRAPTVNELAQYAETSIEDILDGLEAAAGHHTASLDTPQQNGDDDGATIAETIGGEDPRFELIDATASIAAAIGGLSDRERRILELRFGHDHTQSEIAQRIAISQMQVSRVLRRTLTQIQNSCDPTATTPSR
jgi:RNA polymerase sigma-B factor